MLATQSSFQLTGALPQGGEYDGPGVSQGIFRPAVAGAGLHTITYTYAYSPTYSEQCQFTVTVPDPPHYTVHFLIQDSYGSPIPDAVITLGTTENDPGQYSFPGLLPGSYTYHVVATDYHDETGDVEVVDADVYVTVPMKGDDVPLIRMLQNVHVEDGSIECFDAWDSLVTGGEGTSFIVAPGGTAELISAGSIIMLYGTHLQKGAYVHAYITQNGNFCDQVPKTLVAAEEMPAYDAPDLPGIAEVRLDLVEPDGKPPLFRVYPNPTSDHFVFELLCQQDEREMIVRIFTIRGELIKDRMIKGREQQLFSLSGHAPGVFIIVATTDEGLARARILKR